MPFCGPPTRRSAHCLNIPSVHCQDKIKLAVFGDEQKINIPWHLVQWLFLDLNALFAPCEQQENPALRGKPIIVVQTLTDSARAIAASYAAKSFGIKTGTLVRAARRLCPEVIAVQARHRIYTDYHERILKAVYTCLRVEKVCSIDEMACRLIGTERQVPVAGELALKLNAPCAIKSANASPARSESRRTCSSARSRPTCKIRTA
jgi:nucleotidyltransferase/DNA polymerase involved in DNA repair